MGGVSPAAAYPNDPTLNPVALANVSWPPVLAVSEKSVIVELPGGVGWQMGGGVPPAPATPPAPPVPAAPPAPVVPPWPPAPLAPPAPVVPPAPDEPPLAPLSAPPSDKRAGRG
jgi:hypothetical protein